MMDLCGGVIIRDHFYPSSDFWKNKSQNKRNCKRIVDADNLVKKKIVRDFLLISFSRYEAWNGPL